MGLAGQTSRGSGEVLVLTPHRVEECVVLITKY